MLDFYLKPPSLNFNFSLQNSFLNSLPLLFSLISLTLLRNSSIDSSSQFVMIFVGSIILLALFIVYFYEKRRCLSFLSVNWARTRLRVDVAKYLYSLIILIERSDQACYRDQLQFEFNSFLTINAKKACFPAVMPLLETLLTNSSIE